ncbi:MAG: response regulator transcription factor [Ruminococcus sp.]|nr:response regulator transcription factor [Ruminococcus sp.]MBR0512275.1 response regulator transcription factor [Ruminococcus sp.]
MTGINIKVAVCDDQKYHCDYLKSLLNEYSVDMSIYEFNNGGDLLRSNEKFDIIFLDIDMPGTDGMSAAKELRDRDEDVRIVFTTSHDEFVFEAFTVKAFRFLKKPVVYAELVETLQKTEMEMLNTEHIVISQKGKIAKIQLKNIVYMEAFGDGTYIYDSEKHFYESSYQLKWFEEKLKDKGFFRIHRSYLVSLRHVKKIENGNVLIDSFDMELPVSRRNITAAKDEYFNYIKNNAQIR